jgi:hypothetical protein
MYHPCKLLTAKPLVNPSGGSNFRLLLLLPLPQLHPWVRHFNQAGSLPLRCHKGEHFREIPVDKPFYVSMDVQLSNETKLAANIILHDQRGQVYLQVFGA